MTSWKGQGVMFYSIQKNFKKFLSILLIFTFILGEFYPVNAAIFSNDEQAAKSLPYIYAYDNSSLCDVYSSREITDNSLLKKSIYYSFGALGYCNQYSVFEEFYLQHQAIEEDDKLQLSSQIVTDIYNQTESKLVVEYLTCIQTLPDVSDNFHALYVFNEADKLIGFTYEMIFVSDIPADESIQSEEESLLGTSNGFFYNGHPDIGQFTKINPSDYGFPEQSIPDSWKNSSKSNPVEIAKVKFSYTQVHNSASTGATFQGATALITQTVSGSYASNQLIGKSVNLYHCLTGSSDSAPYYKNDSDADSSLYIAANSDNICYMHFYIRSVDTSQHKVFIEIRTDYIDADYNRKNTSVQAVGGGVWYTYHDKSYVSITKHGIRSYIDKDIIDKDSNLSAFSLQGIQYGIYPVNNKNTPIGTFQFDTSGNVTPATIQLQADTDYYFHEICGNEFYEKDEGYYLFNSGKFPINSLENALQKSFVDSIKPYTLYFHKTSGDNKNLFNHPLYSIAGANYRIKDDQGNPVNFIVGYETVSDTNNYKKPILASTQDHPFVTNTDGNLTFSFSYNGDSTNVTDYYSNVQITGNTYTVTFTKDSPLQLFYGKYYICEENPPKGYRIDTACEKSGHEVIIHPEQSLYELICTDEPLYAPVHLNLQKNDVETKSDTPLGAGTLSNAVFCFEYYDSYFEKEADIPLNPTRKWFLSTNKEGKIDFQNAECDNNYASDDFYYYNKQRAIPLGTIVIREIVPPTGYLNIEEGGFTYINGQAFQKNQPIIMELKWDASDNQIKIAFNQQTLSSKDKITIDVFDQVQRGDLAFLKSDYQTGKPMAHIAFILTSKTTGESHIIVTDDNGYATTKSGSIQTVNQNTYKQLHTKDTNKNDIYLDQISSEDVLKNQLYPSGIWFYGTTDKHLQSQMNILDDTGALPYDTYSITEVFSLGNKTTQLIIEDDFTFDMNQDGNVFVYSISDMPTPKFHTSSMDHKTQNHYSLAAPDTVIIDSIEYKYLRYNTTYTFKGILVAQKDCQTKDGMQYKAGQPLLDAQGNFIRSNVSFQTAQQESNLYNANAAGTIDLIYNFDSSNLQGINGVWQTYLCPGSDTELLVINDGQEVDLAASKVLNFKISENEVFYIEDTSLDNIDESVSFMGIDTDAFTSSYHLNVDKTSKNTVVTDTVYLSNLIEGNEYKLISTLVDGQTGEIISDKNGKPCKKTTNNIIYKEDSSHHNMKIDIVLPEFDSSQYLGRHVVVFEELYWNNCLYARDTDITNTRESIYFPYIMETIATDKEGNKTIALEDTVTIVDKVSYSGLAPDKEYKITGTLHYLNANNQECTLYNKSKQPVTATTTFIPKTSTGTASVTFQINIKDILLDNPNDFPKQMVVFEELFYDDISLYLHADITDTKQTVSFPTLTTSLVEDDSQSQFVDTFDRQLHITDYVHYENLTVGQDYTIIGKLINKKTQQPITDGKKEITGSTTFQANESSGDVSVKFTLPALSKEPESISNDTDMMVAYEYLYEGLDTKESKLLSIHANPENSEQTITHVKGHTSLTNTLHGKHSISKEKKISLEDQITYENLIIGKEYEVNGTLYIPSLESTSDTTELDASGNSCQPLFDQSGKKITGHTRFTADKENGTVTVSFSFDAATIPNIDNLNYIVAFEEMKECMSDQVVFSHKDITDTNQTVYFVDIQTEALDTYTKSHTGTCRKNDQIIDYVSYQNLTVGQEYTLKGTLMIKEDAKPFQINHEIITEEITFTPTKSNDTIPVEFNFDSRNLSGKTIVVYEELYCEQALISKHTDINDEKQSVSYPPDKTPPVATGDTNVIKWMIALLYLSILSGGGILCYLKRKENRQQSDIL